MSQCSLRWAVGAEITALDVTTWPKTSAPISARTIYDCAEQGQHNQVREPGMAVHSDGHNLHCAPEP